MAKRKTATPLVTTGTTLTPEDLALVDALAVRARLKGHEMTRSEVIRRLVEIGLGDTLDKHPLTDVEREAYRRWYAAKHGESRLPDLNRRPTVYETVALRAA